MTSPMPKEAKPPKPSSLLDASTREDFQAALDSLLGGEGEEAGRSASAGSPGSAAPQADPGPLVLAKVPETAHPEKVPEISGLNQPESLFELTVPFEATPARPAAEPHAPLEDPMAGDFTDEARQYAFAGEGKPEIPVVLMSAEPSRGVLLPAPVAVAADALQQPLLSYQALPPVAGPVLPPQELSDEEWEIADKPRWYQRWRRGWRLLLVLALLAGGYVMWRGRQDYQRLKQWRARSLAEEAMVKSAAGDFAGAQSLLDKAATLMPKDAVVMRRMADFCESRGDMMALFALRQLAISGQADAADWERLCRLAFDWGHQELAPSWLLNEWAAAPEEKLTPGQLKLSCRWMVMRGQREKAESRLLRALDRAPAADIELTLCALRLGNPADSPEAAALVADALDRLERLSSDPGVSLADRTEAARLMATVLLRGANRRLLTDARALQLKQAFTSLAAECAPSVALSHQLAATSVDLAAHPSRSGDFLRAVRLQAFRLPAPDRLTLARWLNDNGCHQDALTVCDRTEESAGDAAWFTVRLDAMFALKDLKGAADRLSAPGQPLPEITRELFLYRIEGAGGRDETGLKERRQRIEDAAASAAAADVFKAAEHAERLRDVDLALSLYRRVEKDERSGLSARLGIVRCLDANPERTDELMRALESVLQMWPQFDDARSDLIYLRLVTDTEQEEDRQVIAALAQQSPWFIAYRIPAALAELKQGHSASALALVDAGGVPWNRARNGWQAVYGAVLAANGRMDEARAISVRLMDAPLRPGERKLLRRYVPDPP